MVVWGIFQTCMGTVNTYGQLLALRFCLGIFEAGLVGPPKDKTDSSSPVSTSSLPAGTAEKSSTVVYPSFLPALSWLVLSAVSLVTPLLRWAVWAATLAGDGS
jgi:hypothetical protein